MYALWNQSKLGSRRFFLTAIANVLDWPLFKLLYIHSWVLILNEISELSGRLGRLDYYRIPAPCFDEISFGEHADDFMLVFTQEIKGCEFRRSIAIIVKARKTVNANYTVSQPAFGMG